MPDKPYVVQMNDSRMTSPDVMARSFQDEVDIRELLATLWRKKWWILATTAIFTLLGVAGALLQQKRYKATVVLAPVLEQSQNSGMGGGLGSLISQYSGVAALAGISLSGDSTKQQALAILQSELLTTRYIEQNALLPVLFSKQWDATAKQWKTDDSDKPPTLWQANRFFNRKIRDVSEDKKTGLVTLTITWTDPQIAARWANELVKMTNNYVRGKAIQESERNIAYLNEQAAKTNIVEVRRATFSLLENEINRMMLARGRDEYALKVIDPAVAPEKPSSPIPLLWIAGGMLAGSFLSAFIVLARAAWIAGAERQVQKPPAASLVAPAPAPAQPAVQTRIIRRKHKA